MKPNKLKMTAYFDLYGELLTEKQREYYDLYCNQDLTLAEIAELQSTSRQSVYDAINRANEQFQRIEEVTHFAALQDRLTEIAADLEALSRLLRAKGAAAIPETVNYLDSIVPELKE